MSTTTRPVRWRKALVALAVAGPVAVLSIGSAGPVSAAPLTTTSTSPSPSSSATPGSSTSLGKSTGSNGKAPNVTFGVQPANPKGATARAFFDLLLDRGSVNHDNLRVTNYSEKPLLLHVYPADASNALDGGFVVADRTVQPTDIATWVAIGGLGPSNTLRLAARTQIDLPVVITVPLSAQPGDHAGALVVGYDTTSRNAKGDTIQVENRVAARLYARVNGVARASVEVTGLTASYRQNWLPWGRGQLKARFILHNTGNVRESITSLLRLSGLFGSAKVARPLGGPGDVLPGGSVLIIAPVQQIRPGIRETVTVQAHAIERPFGPGGPPSVFSDGSAHTVVTAIPWSVLGALIIIGLLIWAGVAWRRRPRKTGRHGTPRGPESLESKLFPEERPTVIVLPSGDELSKAGRRVPLSRTGPVPRRRMFGTAVLLALVPLAGVLAPAAANAATSSTSTSAHALYFAPARGTSITPAYVVTDSGCPAASSNIVGRAYGHGFPASGQAVVNNSTSGVSHASPFVIPLQDTMNSFAKQNRTKLSGSYKITLTCTDRLQIHPTVTFAGTMRFDSALRYTAPAPPAQIVHEVQAAESAADGSTTPQQITPQSPSSPGATASGGASGQPGPTGGTGSGGSTQAGGLPANVPVSHTGSRSSHQTVLVGGAAIGGLLVLFSAGWLVLDHRRSRSATPAGGKGR